MPAGGAVENHIGKHTGSLLSLHELHYSIVQLGSDDMSVELTVLDKSHCFIDSNYK